MTRFRNVVRILTWIGTATLAAIIIAAVAVPVQQVLFRHRSERLQADMQSIKLHKTSWADAQGFMRNWGAWGHYDGTCTWTNCKYVIILSDWSGYARESDEIGWFRKAAWPFFTSRLYRFAGGRIGVFYAGFVVQDGTIWRTFQGIDLDVPENSGPQNYESEYGNLVHVQSRSSLNPNAAPGSSHWILGSQTQLAAHPDFKAGRPSGCENCMALDITYSITARDDLIHQLTSFDFSCITRWKPCRFPEDILTAARPWHVYLPLDPPHAQLPEPPSAYDIPVWALGRDAIVVLSVDVLSSATERYKYNGAPYERAKVRLHRILKGAVSLANGATLIVQPYSGEQINPPLDPPEHLETGKHYLLLVNYHLEDLDRNHPPVQPELIDGLSGIRLDRCGVLDDTPENRAELARGFAQNDSLRVPEF
jgi:hypothetical protein